MSQHNHNDFVKNGMQQHSSFTGLPVPTTQQLVHQQQQLQQQQQQPQALSYPNAAFPGTTTSPTTPQQRLLQLQLQQQQLIRLQTQQQQHQQQQLLRQQQELQQRSQEQKQQQMQQHNQQQQLQGQQQQQLLQHQLNQQYQQQRQLLPQSVTSPMTSIPSLPSVPPNHPRSSPTQHFLLRPPELTNSTKLTTPNDPPGNIAKNATATPADPLQPPPHQMSHEETVHLLSQCNTTDRTVWLAHRLLGGPQTNGFLRATSTAQRIKKQRARQVQWTKKDNHDEQQQEEDLKLQIMNPRTAKKIKTELMSGLSFCRQMHSVLRGLLAEMDPSHVMIPLEGQKFVMPSPSDSKGIMPHTLANTKVPILNIPLPQTAASPSKRLLAKNTTAAQQPPSTQTNSNPGDPNGSSLRKLRKQKLAIDPVIKLPDQFAKLPKKEQAWRLFSVLRFRALNPGDYVAARVSSRDYLWILARVVTAYPDSGLDMKEFLSLTDARRDALFRDKVVIKDAEESEGGINSHVPRNLVLPLPRSHGEAAEWNTRIKKGSRVYAMYPMTTSLYSATAIDSTSFCRGDDDIVVVEFDGDDQDESGNLPKYHIPARFVTLIPRDFPAANTTSKKKNTTEPIARKSVKHKRQGSSDSALNDMISEMAYSDLPNQGLDQFDLEL